MFRLKSHEKVGNCLWIQLSFEKSQANVDTAFLTDGSFTNEGSCCNDLSELKYFAWIKYRSDRSHSAQYKNSETRNGWLRKVKKVINKRLSMIRNCDIV